MSTHKRNNTGPSPYSPNAAPKSDLPPSRKGKATAKHKTNLPFSRVRFNTFIYILCAMSLAFIAFYSWRILQWKTAAGGWWNLAMGRRPNLNTGGGYNTGRNTAGGKEGESVEGRINALAEALGLPSRDLASAIADAVRNHVPPASLSSVSAAEATESGSVVGVLVGEEEASQPGTGMADKLGAVSGFDDPVME